MDYIEQYNQLKKTQPYVSNQDFTVKKAFNIFTKDQIEEIYNIINSQKIEDTHLQEWAGHRAWHVKFSKNIEKSITDAAQKILGDNISLEGDYSFARYTPEYGFECKLFPHYDTRETQRITFDIQLNADEEWGIVVENETYNLNNNEALIFAGTQQIHWREKKKLKQNTKIDMIFCHLQYKDNCPLDLNQKDILETRSKFLMDHTGINSQIQPYAV
jgi:hypothetical protein